MKIKGALVLAVLAVAMMVFFALADRQPPFVPRDIFHAIVVSNAACTACHTPGKQAPLKASHTLREECLFCHKKKPVR